jgi:hypothetical protein
MCLFTLGLLFASYVICVAVYSVYGTGGLILFLILAFLLSALTSEY